MIGVDGMAIKNEDENDPYGISSTKYTKMAMQQQNTREARDAYQQDEDDGDEEQPDFIDIQDDEPMDEEETDNYNRYSPPQKENHQAKLRQSVGVVQGIQV